MHNIYKKNSKHISFIMLSSLFRTISYITLNYKKIQNNNNINANKNN